MRFKVTGIIEYRIVFGYLKNKPAFLNGYMNPSKKCLIKKIYSLNFYYFINKKPVVIENNGLSYLKPYPVLLFKGFYKFIL